MFPRLGPVELILILVIVTMLFGVGKLPEMFGAVGRGVKEFRKASESDDTPAPPAPEEPTAVAPVVTVAAPAEPVATVTVSAPVAAPVSAPAPVVTPTENGTPQA